MRGALVLLAVLALGGCDLSMTRQARPAVERSDQVWPGGPRLSTAPEGAVQYASPSPQAVAARPTLTLALIQRGRDRYDIYCLPCHGVRGRGDGPVVRRGFPIPPSYDEARLVAAPASHFYDVISNGYGVMFSYGDRLSAHDRWAVAAYIRALQLADQQNPAGAAAERSVRP